MVLSTCIGMYRKKNLPKLNFKGKKTGKEDIKWVFTYQLHSVFMYIHTYIATQHVSLPTLCATGQPVLLCLLDIDTTRIVVSLKVICFTNHEASNIDNNSELIKYFLAFQLTDWTNSKRLMEIQSPMKDPFSTPNPFSTTGQTVSIRHCTQTAFQQENGFMD